MNFDSILFKIMFKRKGLKTLKNKTQLKKLTIMLLVVAMLFTLVNPAMAANATISVQAGDNRTYDVYQIFTGDLDEKENEKILSNVKWGKNGTGTKGNAVEQDVLDTLAAAAGSDTEKLAVIQTYVNLTSEKFGSVSKGNSLTAPTGYYLFKDTGAIGEGEAYSLYVVKVVGTTEIKPKKGTVSSWKKVKDTNDTAGTTTDWQDSADYDINDDVPFQLTGTVPADYANYKTYNYVLHDEQSAGLTFDKNSVKVYVDGTEITEGFEVVTTGLEDGCTFEVKFANLKEIDAVKTGSKITVEYTSELNTSAVVGAVGNPNIMYLEYSNNPNGSGTGTTPEDKVIVFTYKTVINKVDKNENPLAGAEFALSKKLANGSWESIAVVKNPEGTTFTFIGLDDGDYKLEETTTPEGYNTIAPVEFIVTAEHTIESADPALTNLTGNVKTGEITFTINVEAGSLSSDVINQSGATLPETGGIGTTIFYVLGGVLVIGAVVLLVTKKRMAE